MRRGAKICLTLRVVVRQSLILGQAVLALATVGPPLTVANAKTAGSTIRIFRFDGLLD